MKRAVDERVDMLSNGIAVAHSGSLLVESLMDRELLL